MKITVLALVVLVLAAPAMALDVATMYRKLIHPRHIGKSKNDRPEQF
jgi:hypothetical protein